MTGFSTVNANIIKKGNTNMDRTEICKKNFQILFKTEPLTGEGNDAEMMNILQKYIFGEVFSTGALDIKMRELITVVSLTAQQTLPQLKAHINAALNAGVEPVVIREAIYQCAPVIGFPKTLNGLTVMNEVFKERGIETPLQSSETVTEADRYDKGLKIQHSLYGNKMEKSLSGLPDDVGAEAEKFLASVWFGDFYTRKNLDIKTRELLVLCVLVTTGNTEIISEHIQGCIKAGNTPEIIAAAILQCMPYTGFPNAVSALQWLKEVLQK